MVESAAKGWCAGLRSASSHACILAGTMAPWPDPQLSCRPLPPRPRRCVRARLRWRGAMWSAPSAWQWRPRWAFIRGGGWLWGSGEGGGASACPRCVRHPKSRLALVGHIDQIVLNPALPPHFPCAGARCGQRGEAQEGGRAHHERAGAERGAAAPQARGVRGAGGRGGGAAQGAGRGGL